MLNLKRVSFYTILHTKNEVVNDVRETLTAAITFENVRNI